MRKQYRMPFRRAERWERRSSTGERFLRSGSRRQCPQVPLASPAVPAGGGRRPRGRSGARAGPGARVPGAGPGYREEGRARAGRLVRLARPAGEERKGRGAGCAVALLSERAGARGRYKGSSAVPRRLGLPRPRHLPPRRRGRGQGRAGRVEGRRRQRRPGPGDEARMSVSGLKAELKFLESIFDKDHERFRIVSWKLDELHCQFVLLPPPPGSSPQPPPPLTIHCNITVRGPRGAGRPGTARPRHCPRGAGRG